MSRTCDLTGKRRLIGHSVSHSNIKTKKKNEVNLQSKRVYDPETGRTIRLRVSSKALKTLDKVGGLSKYLRKNRDLFGC